MTNYTHAERTEFDRFLALLQALCGKEHDGFDGVLAGAMACNHCARTVPAGIPNQLVDSEWVMCPCCVRAREVVPALQRHLYGPVKDEIVKAEEVKALLARTERAVAGNRLARLKGLIDKLERDWRMATTEEERRMTTRLLAATKNAYRRAGGT